MYSIPLAYTLTILVYDERKLKINSQAFVSVVTGIMLPNSKEFGRRR